MPTSPFDSKEASKTGIARPVCCKFSCEELKFMRSVWKAEAPNSFWEGADVSLKFVQLEACKLTDATLCLASRHAEAFPLLC